MRRAVVVRDSIVVGLVFLAGCLTPPPPSRWNGLWLSPSGEGVIVYSAPDGGVEFGPRRLSAVGGQLTLTQRCSDFDITPEGEAYLRKGKRSGGTVAERQDGFDLTFGAPPPRELAEIVGQITLLETPLDFSLEARLTGDQFTLREVWSDGGAESSTERRFTVSKQSQCLNPP